MNFIKALFGEGSKRAKEAAADVLLTVAPEYANDVHIETVRLELVDVVTKVEVAEDFLETELEQTKVERDKVENGMVALEILQQDLVTSTDDAEKAEIEADMSNLMDEIEQAQVELDRELSEDIEAREDLDFWRVREKELSDYLKNTKNNSEQVLKAIARQELNTQRAKDREKHGKDSVFSDTIDQAMQKKLADLKLQEKVANRMTTLTSVHSVTQTSDRVKAAMAKAKGEVDTSNRSIQDRIADFKQKKEGKG